MSTLAVTGASGHLGRATVEQLLARGVAPDRLVLVTRTPYAISSTGARDAIVRRGNFDDGESLVAAFTGVERLLLISTDAVGRRTAQHRAAIQAAATAGVRHIVYTSFTRPDEANPAAVAVEHRETEELVRASGLAWTILRNNIYAEYQAALVAQAAAGGELVTNAGNGATAYVSRTDCAAAAAASLAGDGHEDAVYDITGPEAISQDELAALAGELTGSDVRTRKVDDQALIDHLVAAGVPPLAAGAMASFGASAREGWLGDVSTAVETLTDRRPRSLRDVLATELAIHAG